MNQTMLIKTFNKMNRILIIIVQRYNTLDIRSILFQMLDTREIPESLTKKN